VGGTNKSESFRAYGILCFFERRRRERGGGDRRVDEVEYGEI
jgi:hypothetical protein